MNLEAASASDCFECAPGKFAEQNATSECEVCPAGKFSLDYAAKSIAVCTDCRGGTYSDVASSTCIICSAGKYAPVASIACISCPRDTYNPVPESDACIDCNMSFCDTGLFRSRCRVGSVNDAPCLNCTEKQAHTRFISHGEYNLSLIHI